MGGIFEEMENELEALTKDTKQSSTFETEDLNDDPTGESDKLDASYGGTPPQPPKVLTPAQYSALFNAVMGDAAKGPSIRPATKGQDADTLRKDEDADPEPDEDEDEKGEEEEEDKKPEKKEKKPAADIDKIVAGKVEKSMSQIDDRIEKLTKAVTAIGGAVKELAGSPTLRKSMSAAGAPKADAPKMNYQKTKDLLVKGAEKGMVEAISVARFEATGDLSEDAEEFLATLSGERG